MVKGHFPYILALDSETSGLALGSSDPTKDARNGKTYQAVSWGFIVADTHTLKPVKELYLEIQFDPKHEWSQRAEEVHGLSREYLAANGVTKEEAVLQITDLLLEFWDPKQPISLLGHNVGSFDLYFLKALLSEFDIHPRFSHRIVDTNSIGFACLETYTSDQLFETLLLDGKRDPSKHNALSDARMALNVVSMVRKLWQSEVNPLLTNP